MVIVLFSCSEKENLLVDNDNTTVVPQTEEAINTSFLSFDTREDYDAIFADPQLLEDKSKANERFISLKSRIDDFRSEDGLRKSTLQTPEDTLFEEYGMLPKILNKDRVVKIGKYYIKIDLLEERALVLKEEHADQYADLVASNIENENIMLFSTDDEVLELLAIGSTGTVTRKSSCGDPTAVRKKDDDFPKNGRRKRLKAKVVYQRVAVYFSILANGKTEKRKLRIWWRDRGGKCFINYDCRFGLKCGWTYNQRGTKSSSKGDATFRPYEGSTSVAYYYLKAGFVSTHGSTNRALFIEDNY